MATAHSPAQPHQNIFHGFDLTMTRALGADMRLVYGIGVPVLMVVGLVAILALNPAAWLVAVILVLELVLLGVVVYGFVALLNESEEDEADFN